MRALLRVLLAVAVVLVLGALPTVANAAVCADYPNQAAAQRAADTRDADGDGIYCESLPCPCSTAAGGGGSTTPHPAPSKPSCVKPAGTVNIGFSATKYPHIRQHMIDAIKKGWPRILVITRKNADKRRDKLLKDIPTKAGYDRDEYPPAEGRGRGHALERGTDPTGWKADVEYVGSHENRSHGSVLGAKLRRYCDGTHFRYVFY